MIITLKDSHVLLIRTPTKPIKEDQYDLNYKTNKLFSSLHHLPILSTQFSSLDTLKDIIKLGPIDKYSGVIISSGRSVEAWSIARSLIEESNSSSLTTTTTTTTNSWNSTPFFVVGPGTRDSLIRLNPPPSELILGHNDGGSGERLANFIIRHFETRSNSNSNDFNPPALPLLALVGDKNRDTVPRMLGIRNIKLELLRVYETNPEKDFEIRLAQVLNQTASTGKIVWIVLFSPSGAKHCLNILREMKIPLETLVCSLPTPPGSVKGKEIGENGERQVGEGKRFRLATIGPTTKAYVEEDEGLKVDAMAESPDAEDLLKALEKGTLV